MWQNKFLQCFPSVLWWGLDICWVLTVWRTTVERQSSNSGARGQDWKYWKIYLQFLPPTVTSLTTIFFNISQEKCLPLIGRIFKWLFLIRIFKMLKLKQFKQLHIILLFQIVNCNGKLYNYPCLVTH